MKASLTFLCLFFVTNHISCSMNPNCSSIIRYNQFNVEANKFLNDFPKWSPEDQNKIVCYKDKEEIRFKKSGNLSARNKYRDSVMSVIFKNIDPQHAELFAEILERLKKKNK